MKIWINRKLDGLRMHKSAEKANFATRTFAQARYSRFRENAPVSFFGNHRLSRLSEIFSLK